MAEIVISGIAGRYPESNNLDEFWNNLINGVDMVTEDSRRWNIDAYDMPRRMGKLLKIDRFDADFFGVHGKQANTMEPKLRFMLELTHEALLDGGVNPMTLRGTKTGVFAGAGSQEAFQIWTRSSENPSGYITFGSSDGMVSNRTSFTFDFKGPSYSMDAGCASSSVAFYNGVYSIKHGHCPGAVVSGNQTCLEPRASLGFHKQSMLSWDGKCRAFDSSGSGFVRAEAVVVFYLCSKTAAKRSYATVVGAKCSNDGFKQDGITFPSGKDQEELARSVYEECGVSPLEVDYVEAHGTGTRVGDPEELNALAMVFCSGRQGPLLVGSTKSNMGHAEYAAGICGLSKVLLAHRHGILPANLHFETANPKIPALLDGRIQITSTNTPFNNAKYAALNSFGFGGSSVHILLKLTPKTKVPSLESPYPVLVPVSGRSPEAVEYFLNRLGSDGNNNRNAVALLHEIFRFEIPQYRYSGYALVGGGKGFEAQVQELPNLSNPQIWFVLTGLGSQWTGMGRDLIKFRGFQDSISKTAAALTEHNFNLLGVLGSQDPETLEDLKNCIVSITAIQVALVDLLASVGVEPGGIVGHSTGECAASYADGSFTRDQAVLVSLSRARAFLESNLPPGTVAAVGLSWDEARRRCPDGVFPAIYNSKNNVTIAGPLEEVRGFVALLKSEGILATEVKSAAYAFHSPYVADSERLMRELLGKVIPEPKARSSKWLSSSIPAERWGSELAKYSSVDYHVNNSLSPVYFYETLLHIPEEAIVIEIGPHCFMQGILKQALPEATVKLGLMSRKSDDNAEYFLNSLGKLYSHGGSIDLRKLYEPVEFPVGPETPMISPWIKWDHTQSWDVPNAGNEISNGGSIKYVVDLNKDTDMFYEGHTLDGRVIFPATGYIYCVWKAFAQTKRITVENLPVVFEQLRFERSTVLSKDKPTEFLVNLFSDNGNFEVTEGGVAVCHGRVRAVGAASIHDEIFEAPPTEYDPAQKLPLAKQDCYKELRLRGYEYKGVFKGISSISMDGFQALLEWHENWVGLLDTLLQVTIIQNYHRDLYLPIRIEKLTIDPKELKRHLLSSPNNIPLQSVKELSATQCPGIEMRRMKVVLAPRRLNRDAPTITEHSFLPYVDDKIYSFQAALDFSIGIVMDNTLGRQFIFSEYFTQAQWESAAASVISHCVVRFEAPECRLVHSADSNGDPPKMSKLMSIPELQSADPSHFLFLDSVAGFEALKDLVAPKGFILWKTEISPEIPNFQRIALKHTENCNLTLYRRLSSTSAPITYFSINVCSMDYSWVDALKAKLTSDPSQRMLVISDNSISGLMGLVKCLIRERGCENIRALSVEPGDLEIDLNKAPFPSQLQTDLVFNVYQQGGWGCYANLSISSEELQQPSKEVEAYANVSQTGDLSSLQWIESPLLASETEGNPQFCKTAYTALNFRDVMLSSGKLPKSALPGETAFDDCVLGIEFSGVCGSRRVMGSRLSKCLATTAEVNSVFTWEIPECWSFAEGATVPVAYATAIYALIMRGHIRAGESVLIHAGSGGVGIAAITVALHLGCTVYTSVGTKEKREFLKKRFPQLKDENITDSRNARVFEQHIMKQTQGRGVDIVLNSLAQDKLQASVRCVAIYGRFLEIGKFDLFENTGIGSEVLLRNVNIQGVFMDDMLQGTSSDDKILARLFQEGIDSGMIQPLPFTSFSPEQLEDAFRYMATGSHVGKVLIEMGTGGFPSLPRTYFHPSKSYVLIGGLGGMGLEVANWMVDRGCRNLVLNSRTGTRNSYQEYRLHVFRERGVSVVVDQNEASTTAGATSVLEMACKLGPIGGIFNMALQLYDALFENQSPALFEAASKAKALATSELDRVSRTLAPELDHFVVFSSIVSARGNPGQTNYGFANSFMERICEERRREGLPGLAIQWGLIDDVGNTFESESGKHFSSLGMTFQKMSSWLPTLDLFLRQERRAAVLCSFLHKLSDSIAEKPNNNSLASGVARILGIKDFAKINPESTLFDLGMDSLMATEVKQLLDTEGVDISSFASTPGQLPFTQILAFEGEIVVGPESIEDWRQELCPFPTTTIRKLESLEQSRDVIFLVHPSEGNLKALELLVRNLEATVYGIEGVRSAPLDSVEVLASFYIEAMKEVQPEGPYKLAGYSLGGTIAFEMAVQLEEEGFSVDSLLFLDSCPKWKHILNQYMLIMELENAIESYLIHFAVSHMNVNRKQLEKDLMSLGSWEEKVAHVAQVVRGLKSELDIQEIKDLANAFSTRFMILFKYEPSKKIKCRAMLIKCVQGIVDKHLTGEYDYGLNEYCYSPAEIVVIQGTHHSFIQEPLELGIPGIMNRMYTAETS